MLPIMLAEIWQWTPLMFLLLLTGLMALPANQIRAARALGASPARIFFKIMLPLLAPVIAIAVVIRAIETFKIFDPVYILTRGQPGGATETISMYMYNGAFVYFRMGYIAAAALLVLALVIMLCLALSRQLKSHG
jgi:multiple sugar transport system permease protein